MCSCACYGKEIRVPFQYVYSETIVCAIEQNTHINPHTCIQKHTQTLKLKKTQSHEIF